MSDPRIGRAIKVIAQSDVRSMAERTLGDITKERVAKLGTVERAFVRAIYAPDKRLG